MKAPGATQVPHSWVQRDLAQAPQLAVWGTEGETEAGEGQ